MTVAGTIPARVEDVTPAWLTGVLQASSPGVVVRQVVAQGVVSGTTSRARLRLSCDGPATAPASLFLKLAPRDLRTRLFVRWLGLGRNEVNFYRTVRTSLAVLAPRVHHAAAARRGARFVLLLEDLLARGCRFADITSPLDRGQAEAVMRTLARLHAAYWEHPRFTGDLAWLRSGSRDLTFRIGRVLSDVAWRPAFARFGDLVPAPLRDAARFVSRHRLDLETAWSRPPRTLIHGDAHLGNLFFDGDEVGMLDWQVAQRGQGLRDVTYFLANSLAIETRRAHGAALIHVYLAALADAGGPLVPFALAWEQHRLHALYAWIAAVVTAAATTLQHEAVVRAGLERSSAAVADLESLAALRALVS